MAIIYNFNSYYAIKKEREELREAYEFLINEVYPNLTDEEVKELAYAEEVEPVIDRLLAKHRLKEYFLITC